VALQDERIPDEGQSHCDCFLCGRRVWIGNPGTGTYSSNARFAPEVPIHLYCLEGHDRGYVHIMYMAAIKDAVALANYEQERARLASLRVNRSAEEMKLAHTA
jgi:hypothetical protein